MVSSLSMLFMATSLIISIAVPLGAAIYFNKKYKISFRAVFTGAAVFLLFALVLEQGMHVYLLKTNPNTASFINGNPWVFAIYGALAAGIFEETGRLTAFKLVLKGRREKKDGIAYGIGHGGIEAILIGALSMFQNLYFSTLINSGRLFETMGGKLSDAVLAQLSSSIINTNSYLFLVSGIERTIAFIIQVSLSLMVLAAVKSGKYRYFALAVLLHGALDFPAAMYQKGMIPSVWIVEAICVIFAAAGIIFVKNWDKLFKFNGK